MSFSLDSNNSGVDDHDNDIHYTDHDKDNESKTSEKTKQRKKREELSTSATKSIKKENVNIVLSFN
jgi:hypothetical protein